MRRKRENRTLNIPKFLRPQFSAHEWFSLEEEEMTKVKDRLKQVEQHLRNLQMRPLQYQYSVDALDSKLDKKLEEAGMIFDHPFDNRGANSKS